MDRFDVTNINLKSCVERRADFYDMIDDDDAFDLEKALEEAGEDGWLVLFTNEVFPGAVQVVAAPDVELSLSLSRRSAPSTPGPEVLASVAVTNRVKAFTLVCGLMAGHFEAEAKNGGDKSQWFLIRTEDALVALACAEKGKDQDADIAEEILIMADVLQGYVSPLKD